MNYMLSTAAGLLAIALLSGCAAKTEELKPTGTPGMAVNVNNPTQTFDPTGQTLLLQGSFSGSGSYRVSGTAKIYERQGKRTLLFENFTSSAGPDLRIYLAENNSAANFIELGKLANSGNFFIDVPANYDPTKQRAALIWCKQFSVLFGAAPLAQ